MKYRVVNNDYTFPLSPRVLLSWFFFLVCGSFLFGLGLVGWFEVWVFFFLMNFFYSLHCAMRLRYFGVGELVIQRCILVTSAVYILLSGLSAVHNFKICA